MANNQQRVLFEWEDSYNTGIAEVDKQHRKLVDIINELYSGMIEERDRDYLKKVLEELSDYTFYHFESEEGLFKSSDYPKQEDHIKLHQRFAAKLTVFKDDFDKGKEDLSQKLFEFLKDWLIFHILDEDMDYVEHIK